MATRPRKLPKVDTRAEVEEILRRVKNEPKTLLRNTSREIMEVACALIAEKFGIDDEYELSTEAERGRLRPKVQRDRDIFDELLAIVEILNNKNVELFDSLDIFDAIERQLLQCAVRFTVDEDGKFHQIISNSKHSTENTQTYHPIELKYGRLHLLLLMTDWFNARIESVLPGPLPERRLAIKKLASQIERRSSSFAAKSIKDLLTSFLTDTEQAITDEQELNEDRLRLAVDGTGSGVNRTPNGEEKLTVDRAVLLVETLGGSKMKGIDQKKKAQMIAFLIENAGGADQIAKRYSEILPSKNPEHEKRIKKAKTRAWEEDIRIVCHYLDLLGLARESEELKQSSLNE